ncbi:hypothetical protein IJH97_01970 [Candidatus Saccharibacteria bacterium]|nr:hypothetical protein [Candidatus Saccharibacteria bacterium]
MSKKLTYSAILAAAVAGSVGITSVLTTKILAKESSTTTQPVVALASNTENTTLADQTVYVFMKTDGSVRKIMTSDWLKSADGTDLYNKSESNSNAPISIKITYRLNDKEISASELAGKSGKVTIRYEYTNNEKSGDYYVPYTVLTGLILSNDNFKNVSATNAKVLNDGSRTIIAGVALPGLQEDLGIAKSTLEIPNYLEITADTTNFKLDMTMSLVTSKLFAELDTNKLDTIDQLAGQLNTLEDAMAKLMNGSSDLYNGLSELNSKSSALVSGIKQLSDGSAQLKDGAIALDAGLGQLQTTVEDTLAAGANAIVGENNQNSTNLVTGVKQIADNSFSTANTNLAGIRTIFNAIPDANIPTDELTMANFATELDAWSAALENETIAGIVETNSGKTKAELTEIFTSTKTSLGGLVQLYTGIVNYTTGVNQLAAGLNTTLPAGIAELKAGSEKLSAGATTLSDGIFTLDNSTPALVEGISKLKDGSGQLKDGLSTFNAEGVEKLVNLYNGNISGLSSRLKTIINLSKNSKSNVKYIYRTDEVK